MEYDNLLNVKNKASLLSALFLSVIFVISIVLNYKGMNFLSFVFIIVFSLFSFRLYIKNKSDVHYIIIKKEDSGDKLYLFDTLKKELISDVIENYDFHKPINKAFEIEHKNSNKIFILYINTATNSILQYLEQKKVPLIKRRKKISFWYLIDTISTL